MSSALPVTPIGDWLASLDRVSRRASSSTVPSGVVQFREVIGVSTNPGATALARTPFGPSSAATVRVSWMTPALVMP